MAYMTNNNPYVLLGIAETATDTQIRQALKTQVKKFCDRDGNGKTADGEYLQKIFLEAAKKLLTPSEREKVDAQLAEDRLKNGVVPYVKKANEESKENRNNRTTQTNQRTERKIQTTEVTPVTPKTTTVTPVTPVTNVNMTTIPTEVPQNAQVAVVVQKNRINFCNVSLLLKSVKVIPESLFGKRIFLSDVLVVIGEDSSFMFVEEYSDGNQYSLRHVFTGENCFGKHVVYSWKNRPYADGQVFKINGIKSIALMGSKFIPVDMINNQMISADNLKKISSCLSEYFACNPQIAQGIFGSKENEAPKVYYVTQPK